MCSRVHLFCLIFDVETNMDYTEYLGPKWKEELKAYKKVIPTIVTNHSSFLDTWILLSSKWYPAFLAKIETKKQIIGY